jgi:pSer/pThr/pTyr-binding forkhead associated (FHA) protein
MERKLLNHGGRDGGEITLDERRLVIGRDESSDLVLHDMSVSRRHLAIETRAETTWVVDLGSSNGTLLNGIPVTCSLLNDQDVIALGTSQILFQQDAASPPRRKA